MNLDFDYSSLAEIVSIAEQEHCSLSSIVLAQQALELEISQDELYAQMLSRLEVMESCIEPGCNKDLRSTSGLTGGDAYKMREHIRSGQGLCGSVFGGALYRALAVSELNASMGRVVAAPTAGSCGILPAAILTMRDEVSNYEGHGIDTHACAMSLFSAAAVGMVIENKASLAGAEGGCQAECGSASAMAAAAIVELAGGSPIQAQDAAALALQNILGLVCDPVAGLVEIPCIKRNASGVANAFVCADLVLAGIKAEIPFDETVDAMRRVGDAMPAALRETAEGGLATTPTALEMAQKVFGSHTQTCPSCTGCCS